MAAKGAIAKQEITDKILFMFKDSFIHDGKEIRIPMTENGENIEIKITLTCAKQNVKGLNAATAAIKNTNTSEPSEEEKKTISNIVSQLF